MKPKEKAKELLDQFLLLQESIEWGNNELKKEAGLIYDKNEDEYDYYYYNLAKASAQKAVQLVLSTDLYSEDKDYWIRVYKQIEKL